MRVLAMSRAARKNQFCDELTNGRDYLTSAEIIQLRQAVKKNRYALRDELLILMAYRHGFRVSELVALEWDNIILAEKSLRVKRVKKGAAGTHPLGRDELSMLTKLKKQTKEAYVFCSERDGVPLQRFAVNKILSKAGKKAGLSFTVRPHMLRHSTGFMLANSGTDTRSIQGYLGHKSINSTVRYTQLSKDRFKGFEDILK
jgi:site-specific recombinase XerD